MPKSEHDDLLVGYNKADDAGVFRISDDLAIVQTVDFFPPIVDDPYQFGQIAAANALSDVYAMGGRPITALNIVGFPAGKMPAEILTEILRGGTDKIEQAGAVVLGGHSVKDDELKYGVSVTGLIDPNRIITNDGARPGDIIYLTKPLGTGLITTGIKRKAVGPELEQIVAVQMAQLNDKASKLMLEHDAHAATDVTGFGLLGHALEVARASGVSIRFDSSALPLMPQALEMAQAGMIPGGAVANREFVEEYCQVDLGIDRNLQAVLYDPQTSGGLLIALGASEAESFEADLEQNKVAAWRIGEVTALDKISLFID